MNENTHPVNPCSFLDLVRHRTSCRNYSTKPVPKAYLEAMLETVRLAPSACNQQPWRLAVVQDEATRLRLMDEAFLPGIPMPWAQQAPVMIVLGVQKSVVTHQIGARISSIEYPLIDLGIAGEHLVLQAEELGLGTCWIGWIVPKKVQAIIGWPKKIKPVSVITVGWPEGERVVRSRKSMDEIVKWM
jgi:nitroreductase